MNEYLWNYQTGVKVSVPLFPLLPFLRHVGILADGMTVTGERTILTTTLARGVHETPASVFANGHLIQVHQYPGGLSPEAVMWRGRSIIGRPYARMNCDEFVEFAHGRPIRSEQIEAVAALAVAGLAIWAGGRMLGKA